MTSLGPDNPAASTRVRRDSHAREYSRLWQARPSESTPPQLAEFLSRCIDLPPSELAAVVRVDLRERWRHGEPCDASEYLDRFPVLATDRDLAVDVVYAEYLVREQLGEGPVLKEYECRFPDLAAVLADQVRLHEAFSEPVENAGVSPAEEPLPSNENGQRPKARRLDADYEILEELGRGGMGVVYKARQPSLNRLVALKMVRRVDLDNDELLSRFRAEAEVVASLHHPHIVQVYDYDQHDGAPYLALELIDGGTLADRLDGKPWNPRRAAQLIEQVARAVHFAHERGVVHRDLKPNNLLISRDEEPLELKIADFGLAKVFRDDLSGRTQTGALLGTPSYMAPEQAYGRPGAVGPAADIYALGAILYELLTGRPPFRGETAIDTLQQVLLAEPASVHRLAPGLPRDLATICSKCLERAPERRYATALELAEDLQRFLVDRPILARPIGSWERSWRWCRRNPALAGSLGSVAALLLAVSIVSTWYSGRLSRQLEITKRAELAERTANEASQLRLWDAYLAEIAARNSSRQMGQRFAALETIERAQRLLPAIGATDARQMQLRNAAIRSLSLPDLRRVRTLCNGSAQSGAAALAAGRFALNENGTTLLVGTVADGAVIAQTKHNLPNARVLLSPDGRFAGLGSESAVHAWRVSDGKLEPMWQAEGMQRLSFVPDGRHAVVSRDGGPLLLVDVESGETVRSFGELGAQSQCWFHAPSKRLALFANREAVIVNWETGKVDVRLPLPDSLNVQMAWHPGGEAIAVWGSSAPIVLWELRTRKPLLSLPQRSFPQQMQFSADGSRLVSCGLWDSRLVLWDVGTGQKEFEVQGFDNFAMDVDASGNLGLMKHDGKVIEHWELAAGSECRFLPSAWFPAPGSRQHGSISPDNRLLALSGERGLELWDLLRLTRVAVRPSTSCMAQFDRQGDLILAVESVVYRWPRHDRVREGTASEAQKKVVSFGPPERLCEIGESTSLATCEPNKALVYETAEGWFSQSFAGDRKRTRLAAPDDPRKAALSRDERFAAIASWEAEGATVWNASTGSLVAKLPAGRWGMLDFSPDGRWLASTPNGVQVWSTSDWSLARNLDAVGTTPNGLGIAFSRDSRVLAVGQTNGELRFVNPETGQDWARLLYPPPGLASILAFTSDNRTLIALPTDDSPGRVWDLLEIRRSLAELNLDWPSDVLPIGPESQDASQDLALEIQWNDAGWSLFQNALKAVRRRPTPAE